ncbi:hypothetical protein LEP1GSC021_0037 [Leptospira noguchii str. 1993005606]|uniref:Uncharacterized protein n=2 Tax=Leptospira noguchii TaxID=28182 RepID=A0ABN0J6J6_9LEPT|nr:hypothetical protein LEP1GSC035_1651 [Leptospira noguchii str. 2007001578]EPE85669.1 hypothetical protein LEP1GSC021_0037 [Leptospira noguchii str. 1993005606]
MIGKLNFILEIMKKILAQISRYLLFFIPLHSLLLLTATFSEELYNLQYHPTDSLDWVILIYLVPAIAAAFLNQLIPSTYFDTTKHRIITTVYLSIGVMILFWSKSHWGYYLSRPSIPNSIKQVKQLESELSLEPNIFPTCNLKSKDRDWQLTSLKRFDYDTKRDRIEYFLDDTSIHLSNHQDETNWRKVLNKTSFRLNISKGIKIHDFIQKNYTFDQREAEYNRVCFFSAVDIFEFIDFDGNKIYYVGYSTHQLSNDHYAYYEFIIYESENGYQIKQSNRFFYDVAGIEGLEFPYFMLLFNILYISFSGSIAAIHKSKS